MKVVGVNKYSKMMGVEDMAPDEYVASMEDVVPASRDRFASANPYCEGGHGYESVDDEPSAGEFFGEEVEVVTEQNAPDNIDDIRQAMIDRMTRRKNSSQAYQSSVRDKNMSMREMGKQR